MILEKIKKEILSRPNVTAEQHKFGGIEFPLNKSLSNLPFPMKTRDDLVNSGHVSPHHVMPQSGWVSYWIEKGEEDVAAIIGLFRLRYEQLKPKSHAKQEGKVEQGGFSF